jgi:hypothetical protein
MGRVVDRAGATMTYQDPNSRHPSVLDPQPAARATRDGDDFDKQTWTYGVVVAAMAAAVAMIGAVIWATHGNERAAARPQPPVTGTFGQSVRSEVQAD